MSHRLLIRRLSPWALALHLLLASPAVPANGPLAMPVEPQEIEASTQATLPSADPAPSREPSSWPARASEWLDGSGASPWAVPAAWAGAAFIAAALAVQIRRSRKSRIAVQERAARRAEAVSRAAEWRSGMETRRAPEALRSHRPESPARPQPERTMMAQPRPAPPVQQPARRDPGPDRNQGRANPAKQATTPPNVTQAVAVTHTPAEVSRAGEARAHVFGVEASALDHAVFGAWNAILCAPQESSAPSPGRTREEQKDHPSAGEAPPAPVQVPIAANGLGREAEPSPSEGKSDEIIALTASRPEESRSAAPETPHALPIQAQADPLQTPPLPARGEGSAGAPEGAVQGDNEAASQGDNEAASLLLHLSHREPALGHIDEALDSAREAHRTLRSRASLTHLIRLLTVARRFEPEDRERLRRAVRKQPNAPVLLHAAGVSESLHGDPWAARGLLLEALRHERREEIRAEILGVLTSLEAPQRSTLAPASPDRPGSDPDELPHR